jgi:hypothetical protein
MGSKSIEIFGLDDDGLLMDQRRLYLIKVRDILAAADFFS